MLALRLNIPHQALSIFCQKWNVRELSLFGSVLREDFRPHSDVDVLMTMRPGAEYTWPQYLQMKQELESLVGRTVDLLDRRVVDASRNWVRRNHILSNCQIACSQQDQMETFA